MPVPPAARFPDASRQGMQVLVAGGGGTPAVNAIPILKAEASEEWPRLVTLISDSGQAFDAAITWRGGKGSGGRIKATAFGGVVRFCVAATAINVFLANWSVAATNTVRASVTDLDGVPTSQELPISMRALAMPAAGVWTMGVPPFAKVLNVQCSSLAQLPNLQLDFLDSAGVVIFTRVGTDRDIEVGPASSMRITNNNGGVVASVVQNWKLSL